MNTTTSSNLHHIAVPAQGSADSYSTREVADWIGLKPTQVRHYVRRRLVRPQRSRHGRLQFSFQDVVLLRTAKALLSARITPRRANRALLKLQGALQDQQSLASVKIRAQGPHVVVCADDCLWDAVTGQGQLNFDEAAPKLDGATVAPLPLDSLIVVSEPQTMDTDAWYNMGLDLEELEPERAPEAYRQAIALDPSNADAHVNLGRLYQMSRDLRRAKQHYQQALEQAPEHRLAAYNLGTVFDELEELDRAAEYYRAAIDVPDAHYNLARISEIRGDELAARRYMRSYRALLDD